jgi:hypothetical protein
VSPRHTPGPWKVYQDYVHPVLEDGSNGNESHAICQCFGPDALINQHLIAAAPELLEACRALVATPAVKPYLRISPYREIARAIATAEGRGK